MKRLLFTGLLAIAAAASAQNLALPEQIKPAQQGVPSGSMDAPETGLIARERSGNEFAQWYASQKRPAVVVYFNRELAELPAGWEGRTRLLIEDTISDGKVEDKRTVTVGVQHNTRRSRTVRGQFARLFEQSLTAELKRQNLRLLDSSVLHRKTAARSTDRNADVEYESLSRSARFLLEVELLAVDGGLEAVAHLKDINTGEIVATVRQEVENLNSATEVDRLNRAISRRLMQSKIS